MAGPEDIQIRAIRIETSKGGHSRVLTSIKGLAEYLLNHWPVEHATSHRTARLACLEAFEGKLTGEEARIAFIKACEEADIFVFPDEMASRPEPRPRQGRKKK